jgi:ABC-type antimicrobial peptide transport system permease subunit
MLPFSIMVDYESLDGFFDFFAKESWTSTSGNAHVYLLKPDGVAAEQIKEVLPAFGAKYLAESSENTSFYLQKYSDIHFQTEYGTYNNRVVEPENLVVPILIGLFLILTACVNFINLATAQAVRRSKEVGIRKVLGGQKKQLAFQFLGETFFLTLVSVIISLGMAELALQNLPETILKYNLSLDLFNDLPLLTIIVSILVVVTVMAGGYPAVILSSMKPVMALKGKGSSAMAGKSILRRGLVIFQFFTSQVLVIGTLVVVSQMNFFLSADLGFRRSSVINFRLPESSVEKVNLIRSELSRNARITDVSFAFTSPRSDTNIGTTFNYVPLKSEADFDMAVKIIDENFVPLYDIELLAGRNLTPSDTIWKSALVSETLMKIMNITDPQEAVGKVIQTGFNGEKTIVGVFRDFHSNTLKSEMAPLLMLNAPNFYRMGSISFEGNETETADIIASLKAVWDDQFPEYVFDHQMYSQLLEDDYAKEAETLDLFQVFSAIAILIGCLGLYGLISFMANQKTKEIGVRKVLGASVMQILKLFSSELLLLIGISFLLAAPVAYWLSSSWLQDFEYSISIDIWVFVVAIGLTFLVSALTTGFRSLKAAKANPVDSLRSE